MMPYLLHRVQSCLAGTGVPRARRKRDRHILHSHCGFQPPAICGLELAQAIENWWFYFFSFPAALGVQIHCVFSSIQLLSRRGLFVMLNSL